MGLDAGYSGMNNTICLVTVLFDILMNESGRGSNNRRWAAVTRFHSSGSNHVVICYGLAQSNSMQQDPMTMQQLLNLTSIVFITCDNIQIIR